MLDTRLGKFLSIDAYASKAPSMSPYSYANNSPIRCIDNNGDSVLFYSETGSYLGYSNDNQRYKGHNLLVIIKSNDVKAFGDEYNRKRSDGYKKDNELSSTQVEAHVAGLEAMGTSVDVTDIVGFFNKYKNKKKAADGSLVTVHVETDLDGSEMYVEWTAPIHNKAVNMNDKGGSVAVDESKAYTENSPNSVSLEGSSVFGFRSMHTHSSINVEPDPSSVDKDRLNLIKSSDWNIVVGQGMFTLYRDANPETGGGNREIEEINIYTHEKFTSNKNKGL
jgi:hypothetical protein